jgi:hypothetical protein
MAVLFLAALVLSLAVPAAAAGPVTQFAGIVTDSWWDISAPTITPLSGGRMLWEDTYLRDLLFQTGDDRIDGEVVLDFNGIQHPGGNWTIWGTALSWDVAAYPGGSWEGKWHGTMRLNEDMTVDGTVVGEYEGTGDLAGLHMHLVYKVKGGNVNPATVSGFIRE